MQCHWEWGYGDCDQILLARGQPFDGVDAIVRRLGLVAFNPSIVLGNKLLVRAQRLRPDGTVQPNVSAALLIYNGTIIVSVEDAEDTRAVATPDGNAILVYSRAHFGTNSYAGRVEMVARRVDFNGIGGLPRTLGPPIALRPPPGWPEHKFEKNWVPFTYLGELFLSYSLEPHVVLRCQLPRHEVVIKCKQAYRTSSPRAWQATDALFHGTMQPRYAKGARGGSPLLPIHMQGAAGESSTAGFLGIAHYHPSEGPSGAPPSYFHFFYFVRSRPPFDVTAVSPPFRFLSSRRWTGRRDRIQFASGLQLVGRKVIVTYGSSDQLAMWTALDRSTVAQLLRGERKTLRIATPCALIQCNDSRVGEPCPKAENGRFGKCLATCVDEAQCMNRASVAGVWRAQCSPSTLSRNRGTPLPMCAQ